MSLPIATDHKPWLHERLKQLAERVGKCKTVEQASVMVLVMADLEEHRFNEGLKALAADMNATEWVGGFTADQFAEIAGAIRKAYKPHMGHTPTVDELVDGVKTQLIAKGETV